MQLRLQVGIGAMWVFGTHTIFTGISTEVPIKFSDF